MRLTLVSLLIALTAFAALGQVPNVDQRNSQRAVHSTAYPNPDFVLYNATGGDGVMVRLGNDADYAAEIREVDASGVFPAAGDLLGRIFPITGWLNWAGTMTTVTARASTEVVTGNTTLGDADTDSVTVTGNVEVNDGLVRVDDGTNGGNESATDDGDLYVEDTLENDGLALIGGGTFRVEGGGVGDITAYGVVRVFDGATGSNGIATASGDLYVEDDLEVDDDAVIADDLTAGGEIDANGTGTHSFSGGVSSEGTVRALTQMQVVRYSNTAGDSPNYFFDKSAGTNPVASAVSNGHYTGQMIFRGHDGTSFYSSARIRGQVDGTVSSGVVPQGLYFSTGTNTAPTERLRISSGGTLTATLAGGLEVNGFTGATGSDLTGNEYQDGIIHTISVCPVLDVALGLDASGEQEWRFGGALLHGQDRAALNGWDRRPIDITSPIHRYRLRESMEEVATFHELKVAYVGWSPLTGRETRSTVHDIALPATPFTMAEGASWEFTVPAPPVDGNQYEVVILSRGFYAPTTDTPRSSPNGRVRPGERRQPPSRVTPEPVSREPRGQGVR